ncbi:MAG: glycoside hydrolase family 3 protein [Polyangiaceae bacterium]|nr:glycoside hydrolase family 3 protein [Polyangiaceae bacterium]
MSARTLLTAFLFLGLASINVGCGDNSSLPNETESGSGGLGQTGGSGPLGAAPSGGNGSGATPGGGSPAGGGSPVGGAETGGIGPMGGTSGSGGVGPSGGTAGTGSVGPVGGTSGTGGNPPTGGTSGSGGGTAGSGGLAPTGGTSGSGGTTGGTSGDGGAETTGGTAGEPSFTLPVAIAPWTPSDACKTKAAEILGGLSLSQKVAQMIQGETLTTTPADVTNYQLGAVFGGGSGDPPANNGAAAWAEMASQYQNAAMSFGIPILYGIDAVHGHNNVRDATMFPHNVGLGCTRDADLVRRVARATAEEVRGTGINWTFAPTIAAARDERWGRTMESFSEDPTLVAWLGQAAVDGMQQGTSLDDPLSILGCAKHFAGDGNTANGTDQGDVIMDEATFRRLAVDQYQPLINSGVATVMISYSQYGTSASTLERVTGSEELVTNLLKNEMGFAGIVVSDYNAIMKLPGAGAGMNPAPSAQQVAAGINAGLDMLMMAGTAGTGMEANWKTALELLEAAADASIPLSRIDDAVTRILQVKCEMGMFEPGYGVQTDTSQIGSAPHRAVAREAVTKSLVVLENDNGLLPLPSSAQVLVAGTAADSMVKQCGGWTIDWQGLGTGTGHSADADTTAGTTILAGIRAAVGEGNVTFSQEGTGSASGATAGIVVVGESPYAEQYGDATDLTLQARSSADHTALQNMLGNGLPIVLIVISGRPLILDSYLDNPNLQAVIAAWLPGSEGAGVADVLFGAVAPSGRLGHSWPRAASQIPINWDDADYASAPPAFPIGHGLSW